MHWYLLAMINFASKLQFFGMSVSDILVKMIICTSVRLFYL